MTSNSLNILKGTWKLISRSFYTSILVVILLLFLPNKNLITINLIILLSVWINKIIDNISFSEKPSIKDYTMSTLKTTTVTTLFVLVFQWLGVLGILGYLITLAVLAVFRIWGAWDYFNYNAWWIAHRLKGDEYEYNLNDIKAYKKKKEEVKLQ